MGKKIAALSMKDESERSKVWPSKTETMCPGSSSALQDSDVKKVT